VGKLLEYVLENITDGMGEPTSELVADMIFFKVMAKPTANKAIFEKLAREEFLGWFDGEKHSYLQNSRDVGDRGYALMIMALGHLLFVWDLMTPAILDISINTQKRMAEIGMLSIQYNDK